MAKKSSASLGKLLLQIALGAVLIVAGIGAFTGGGDFGAQAFNNLIKNNTLLQIIRVVYGVIELVAGVFLILELFVGDRFGKFDNILNLIVIIIWLIAILLFDFVGGIAKPNFLAWLLQLAQHVLLIGALLNLND
ncbi:MAG: hypothetical protein IKX23_10390 [Treponema sp.]|nr:hypothetical protein [Treponema sp.]